MVDISSFEGNESDVFESVNESLTSIFRRAKFPPIDRFHASIIFFLSKEDFIFHPIYLLFCPSFIYSASRTRQKQLLSPFDNHHQPEDGGIFSKIPRASIAFIADFRRFFLPARLKYKPNYRECSVQTVTLS